MRRLLLFVFVVVLCAGAVQAEPLPVRGWQFHHRNLDYLLRAVDVAAGQGINHIQSSHDIVHNIEDLLRHEERQHIVNEVTKKCHEKGMEVYLWTHEFNDIPHPPLTEDGKVNLDDDAIWDWAREKYKKAFALAPDIDGLILTFHETNVSVYHDHKVISAKSPAERVTQQIDFMHDVCAKAGKKLYVRTFVYEPDELSWVIDGIRAAHPDVGVMTKCIPHDWHPLYPHNPALGRFPDRIQIMELDPGAEYYGHSYIPYNQVDYMKYRLDYAVNHGVDGAVARVGRMKHPILGTMNEVNLYAFARYMQEPDIDADTVWQEWTEREFGAAAAPAIESAYRRTYDIIVNMYLMLGFSVLNEHSRVPGLGYANHIITTHSLAKWDDSYQDVEDELLRPGDATYDKVMAEKHKAVELARQSLADVDSVERELLPAQFLHAREPLEKLYRCTRLWVSLADVYMKYRLFLADRTPGRLAAVMAACQDTEAMADQIATEVGADDVKWENAERTRRFVNKIREDLAERTTGKK